MINYNYDLFIDQLVSWLTSTTRVLGFIKINSMSWAIMTCDNFFIYSFIDQSDNDVNLSVYYTRYDFYQFGEKRIKENHKKLTNEGYNVGFIFCVLIKISKTSKLLFF